MALPKCCDPTVGPAPFSYFVWQKGKFLQNSPLIMGISSPFIFIAMSLISDYLIYILYGKYISTTLMPNGIKWN